MFIKSIILKKPFNEILPAFHLRLSIDRENYSQGNRCGYSGTSARLMHEFFLEQPSALHYDFSAPGLPLEREDIRIQDGRYQNHAWRPGQREQ